MQCAICQHCFSTMKLDLPLTVAALNHCRLKPCATRPSNPCIHEIHIPKLETFRFGCRGQPEVNCVAHYTQIRQSLIVSQNDANTGTRATWSRHFHQAGRSLLEAREGLSSLKTWLLRCRFELTIDTMLHIYQRRCLLRDNPTSSSKLPSLTFY